MSPVAEVIGLVRAEFQRRIKGWKRSLIAGAVAALFLGLALLFALIALFLHLADAVGAPGAALIMAAGLGLIGVIALVIASLRPRRRDIGADIQAVAAVQMEQMKQLAPGRVRTSTLLKGLGIAFAIGLISGWRR